MRSLWRSADWSAHTILAGIVAALTLSAVTAMVALWAVTDTEPAAAAPDPEQYEEFPARIDSVALTDENVSGADAAMVQITATLDTGEQVTFNQYDPSARTYRPGMRVTVAYWISGDQDGRWQIAEVHRTTQLWTLTALFVLAVVAFGRWQGVRALVGLAATIGVMLAFVVPVILAGWPPVMVTLIAAVPVMTATLYLSHGFNAKTTAAICGTIGALAFTGLLAWAFTRWMALTGRATEESVWLDVQTDAAMNMHGLLLAGIIIGSLGVLDDVTVSQSSTVHALRAARSDLTFAQLVGRALTVGRDHVAATVNTLFLAYAGAALPLLMMFHIGGSHWREVLASELVVAEIIRTLAGSIGLIAAVPVTTALAAWLALRQPHAEAGAATQHHH